LRPAALVALGVIAGLLSGMLGIGGGTVVGPVLALAGLPIRRASGTALALVAPVALAGVASELWMRQANLDLGFIAVLAAGGVIGVMLARRTANRLPERLLRRLFALLLLITALRQFGVFGTVPAAELPGWFGGDDVARLALAGLIGGGAGVCAILFGVGGGIVIVPGLVFAIGGFGMREASAVSLAAMIPLAGYGAFAAWRDGRVDTRFLTPLLSSALLAAAAGVWLRNFVLAPRVLAVAFGCFLILVAGNLLRKPMNGGAPTASVTPRGGAATDPRSERKS
jgi:uncharacterized membrane protein YfcA